MAFTRVNPGGWALYEVLTSSQMNSLDINVSNAVDGGAGGTYNSSAKLTWNHQLEVDASSYALDGIIVTGGSGDSAAIVATGGVTNGNGIETTGDGTGAGLDATGGDSNGIGVNALGDGTGAGVKGDSSTGPAFYANKSLEFHGTLAYQNPAATTGLTNELRATLVPKLWGTVSTGGGGPTIDDGANIASVSYSGSNLVVTIADDMASVYYAVSGIILRNSPEFLTVPSQGATNFQLSAWDASGDPTVQINLSSDGRQIMFMVIGEQAGDLS